MHGALRDNDRIEMIDLLGRRLLVSAAPEARWSVASIPSGTYIIRACQDQRSISGIVIVRH
jgi:hypothetical protein